MKKKGTSDGSKHLDEAESSSLDCMGHDGAREAKEDHALRGGEVEEVVDVPFHESGSVFHAAQQGLESRLVGEVEVESEASWAC